jgi:hypothetical protein
MRLKMKQPKRPNQVLQQRLTRRYAFDVDPFDYAQDKPKLV